MNRILAGVKSTTTNEETDDDSQFVPSPLDLSVRIGHGGRVDEIDRELSKIDDQARELDDTHRTK